jgi:hypothetical protein
VISVEGNMRLEVLLSGLENPQTAVRLDVVRVLGMLDETRALDNLRERYPVETDADVRNAIGWAGKRLYQAQQAGYSTLSEVFRHFGVDREIENRPDETEAKMMQQLQNNFDRDLRQMQGQAMRRKVGIAAVAALGGAALGGTSVGAMAFAGAMQPGADTASSGLGSREQMGARRAPATAPSSTPVDIWVKRLRETPSAELREQAALELAQLNNPKALPFLAAAFVTDAAPQVRQAAQKYGKVLYWTMVYWEMEQDGSLAQEIEQRAANLHKSKAPATDAAPGASAPAADAAQPPKPAEVDVTEILRKAQQARAERKRKS